MYCLSFWDIFILWSGSLTPSIFTSHSIVITSLFTHSSSTITASFTICSIIINPPLTYNFTIVFVIYLNVLRDSTTVTTMGTEAATQ
ncbi:hypothetical protein PM082_020005 [Marasmius tenuissimus]|nr:hypothetical protein PM082_020005 [Marasmius tenuissimus]